MQTNMMSELQSPDFQEFDANATNSTDRLWHMPKTKGIAMLLVAKIR